MSNNAEYQSLLNLLPFYVNGTLGTTDCARIDAMLETSAELRAELEMQHQIARKTIQEGRAIMATASDPEEQLQAILPQLGNTTSQSNAPRIATQDRPSLSSLLKFLHPREWHPAVSLSLAVAVAGLAGAIAVQSADQEKNMRQIANLEGRLKEVEFQLASGSGGEVQRGSIMIQLRKDAKWADVEALLSKEDLSIIGGPNDGALSLSSREKDAALDALIARLKSSPLIASADKIT
jgi:hypothetical protein